MRAEFIIEKAQGHMALGFFVAVAFRVIGYWLTYRA